MKSSATVLLAAVLASAGCQEVAGRPTDPGPMPATFANGDVRLAFALDLPEGQPPFPAVVFAHGSGRVTRDQMRWASAEWRRFGFAVLRFDKRGVGESTGEYSGVGVGNSETLLALLASDVAAGVRFLRTRPEIDPQRIGLFGNSQAGWILPQTAQILGDARFMVLYSGPVCTVGLENYFSDLVEFSDRPLSEAYPLLAAFNGPPGYDPVPTLRRITTPSLWLLGTDDRSIPIPTTIANLQALAASGKPFEWRTYEGMGHSLSPSVWPDVGAWLQRLE